MTVPVAELDAMPEASARALFVACCGARHWVDGMLARRPFGTAGALLGAADAVWDSLGEADWREAFSHHPRIGERASAAPQDARAAAWSAGEQAGVARTPASVQAEMAQVNADYERRFGVIYIVCATGKSAAEMLDIARGRLANDPETELRVAAGEQAKITRLRLRKLIGEDA